MRTIQENCISREIHPQGVGGSQPGNPRGSSPRPRKRWREKAAGFKKNSDFLLRDMPSLRPPHLSLVPNVLAGSPLRASQVAQW